MPPSLATLLLLIGVLGAEGVATIHAPLQVAIAGEVIMDTADVHRAELATWLAVEVERADFADVHQPLATGQQAAAAIGDGGVLGDVREIHATGSDVARMLIVVPQMVVPPHDVVARAASLLLAMLIVGTDAAD